MSHLVCAPSATLICCPTSTHRVFAESTRTTYQIYQQRVNDKIQYETPNAMTAFLGKRWRAERNFWISLFAFTMWGCAVYPLGPMLPLATLPSDLTERVSTPMRAECSTL